MAAVYLTTCSIIQSGAKTFPTPKNRCPNINEKINKSIFLHKKQKMNEEINSVLVNEIIQTASRIKEEKS